MFRGGRPGRGASWQPVCPTSQYQGKAIEQALRLPRACMRTIVQQTALPVVTENCRLNTEIRGCSSNEPETFEGNTSPKDHKRERPTRMPTHNLIKNAERRSRRKKMQRLCDKKWHTKRQQKKVSKVSGPKSFGPDQKIRRCKFGRALHAVHHAEQAVRSLRIALVSTRAGDPDGRTQKLSFLAAGGRVP